MIVLRALLLATIAASGVASSASAYSDPERFAEPVWEGGGGGRWFSGTRGDGHRCDVCHTGGAQISVSVSGLPLDGYVPGASYEVVVAWLDSAAHVGAVIEVSDDSGSAAGTWRLPEGAELQAADTCLPRGTGIRATSLHTVSPTRSVIAVADCGAGQLRALWTAPPADRAVTLRFTGGLVSGDGNAHPSDDGTTAIAHTLRPIGDAPPRASTTCAVSENASHAATSPIVCVMAWWIARARASRRARRSVAAATTQ